MNQMFERIHERAIEIAKRFHQAESDLIDILQQIDEKKVFIRLGCGSLFDYATKKLRLSEANASNFITVARKSKSVPELKQAIRAGTLTVSKARKITPVLTKENSSHWLELAKSLPKPQLEREVAKVLPQTLTPEKARYVTEDRLELKVGISEATMKKLRRAQDLVSQKTHKAATLEETLVGALDIFLERIDPVEKAKRMAGKSSSTANSQRENGSNDDANASVLGTRYLPARIKHQVVMRDRGQCSFVDINGDKCANRRWLEVHHKIPLSRGGTNEPANLQTLCSVHHSGEHLIN